MVYILKKQKIRKYTILKGASRSRHAITTLFIIPSVITALFILRPTSIANGYQRHVNQTGKSIQSVVITNFKKTNYPLLVIPSINVNAPIVREGLTKTGAMAVPNVAASVGWYKLGTFPGQKGSAVLAGHVSTIDHSQAAFNKIDLLKKGDKIIIEIDKLTSLTFIVQSSHNYGPNDKPLEVFNKDDGKYLNLITCDGKWDSSRHIFSNRLVVFTTLE